MKNNRGLGGMQHGDSVAAGLLGALASVVGKVSKTNHWSAD